MKYGAKAGANLHSLTYKLSQGNKVKSNHKNNIVVQYFKGNIILDFQIKTHDGWVARVKFLQETCRVKAQLANAFTTKDINNLHAMLGHLSKVITHATAKSMDNHLTGTFRL